MPRYLLLLVYSIDSEQKQVYIIQLYKHIFVVLKLSDVNLLKTTANKFDFADIMHIKY